MEQEVKIFEHEKFGKVRVIIINGEPWFVGKDVATALKYSDAFAALKQHVPDKSKRVINAKTLAQMASQSKTGESPVLEFDTPRGMTFINEAGLYKLVLRSKLPAAEEFSDWVCEEVLPSIRKYGYYSLVPPVNAPVVAKPVRVPNPNRVAAQLADASVYVIRVGEEYVKIGNSKNVEERKSNLKSWRGMTFGEDYKTVRFPRTIARKIEKTCQQIFSPYHVEGEIFHVKYEMARLALKALEQLVENLPLISNPKFGDKLLKIAEMMGDTPELKALLLEAGNIFVDKKFE